jgi:hypothetical protein
MAVSVRGIPDTRKHQKRRVASIAVTRTGDVYKVTGNPYTGGMATASNVTPIRTEAQRVRALRGAFVEAALREERWTIRQASIRLGLSNTALGDRVKGRVSFLAEDIEDIAELLKREPVEFYSAYLAAKDGHDEPSEATQINRESQDSLDWVAPVIPLVRVS